MRPAYRKLVRTVFAGSLIAFTIVNFNLYLAQKRRDSHKKEDAFGNPSGDQFGSQLSPNDYSPKFGSAFHPGNMYPGNFTFLLKPNATWDQRNQTLESLGVSFNLSAVMNGSSGTFNMDTFIPLRGEVDLIQRYISQANKQQHIRNLDSFDLSSSPNSVVIVVQVHNRNNYLRYLIDSFRIARHIEQALLIFSHDFFDDDVNHLIHTINFAPVMQIFYPIPIQLHPHEFPGEDPADCPRDANKEKATQLGCKNAGWPDRYGHYREAKYTQTKHHWFWKINHVFDYLEVTRNFNGPVLFVEEDHLVTPDFLDVLVKMYRFSETACKDCNIFTLGTYLKRPEYGASSKKVDIMNWVSSKHNMGMSVDRNNWQKIKRCAKEFCEYDDYNWDWSLQYISNNCIPSKLRCMLVKSPRIYHIGQCGVHHKGKNCDVATAVEPVHKLIEANLQFLFPQTLEVGGFPRTPNKMPKPNGGWGDQRDKQLCLSFLKADYHG